MGRGATIKTSFNAGELSPLLDGRTDLAKYQGGCSVLENFLPTVHGPVRRRPGTRFLAAAPLPPVGIPVSADPVLVPFVYNREQAYVLAFSRGGIRVLSDRGFVETTPGSGVPYVFGSGVWPDCPRKSNGDSRLSFAQSGDTLFVCDPGDGPLIPGDTVSRIVRLADNDWRVRVFFMTAPPVSDPSSDGSEFSVWWSASDSCFYAHVDGNAIFDDPGVAGIVYVDDDGRTAHVKRSWSAGMSIAEDEFVIVDGRWYQNYSGSTSTMSNERPTHTDGTKWYGGAWLQYVGYGRFFFDVLESGLDATADVGAGKKKARVALPAFPTDAIAPGFYQYNSFANAIKSTYWGAESVATVPASSAPKPERVAFFRNRLVFSVGQKLYFSAPGNYNRFDLFDHNGEVTADAGIAVEISIGDVAGISWMVATDVLLVGTLSGEWVISEQNTSDPFGPGNIKLEQYGASGSAALVPLRVDDDALYFSRTRNRLRRLTWSSDQEAYKSLDLSLLADHLGRVQFSELAFQREPSSVVWICNKAGDLLGFTYDREQDVSAWHRHDVGGKVRAVCCIPSPDGTRDDLWLVVEREIDGESVRYFEFLADDEPFGAAIEDAFYLDCGATYSGSPATTISGLDHLDGETVQVVADGAVHPDRVVEDGSISLAWAASKVHVGLHHPARLRTMRIEAAADDGVGQGKTKRIHRVTLRLIESVGVQVGPSFERMDRLEFRKPADPMDRPVPPFTGDKALPFPGGYEEDGFVCLQQDQPLPLTVVAIIPELQVNSR